MDDVERFPSNISDARAAQLKIQQAQPLIARDLVPEEASFHFFASQKAFIQEEEPGCEDVVRIVNTAPIEFPMTAGVVPHTINDDMSSHDVIMGGEMGR
jgi:hypothetical protein